jgi:hypothetical protein
MGLKSIGATLWAIVKENRLQTASVVAGVTSLVTLGLRAGKIYDAAAAWTTRHVSIVAGKPAVDSQLVLSVCVSGLLAATLAVACIVLLIDDVHQRNASPRTTSLKRALRIVTDNSKRIVYQAYPPSKTPPWLFDKMVIDIFVGANGDAIVKREEHLRADGAPLRMWNQIIVGEDDSTPIEFVEQLNYKVEDKTTKDGSLGVAHLVLNNDPRLKEIAIFHLPEIEPGETSARIVMTEFAWPGLSTKLKKDGTERWEWIVKSRKNVPLFELKVSYDRSWGKVACEVVSARTPTSTLEVVESAAARGWKYTVPDSPANGFKHELKFSRET